MFEWVFINNDPLATARFSIMESLIVFVLALLILSWCFFYLLRRTVGIEKLNSVAVNLGYDNWESIRFFFIRDTTFYSSMFLMGVIMVYMFTHMMEVKEVYFYGSLPDMARQCRESGGGLTCQKLNFNGSFGSGLWNSSPIIDHSNTH
jgi:hypothetical protein